MSGQKIRVCVVGAGNMAKEHLRAFAHLPGVELAGIWSRTHSRAKQLGAEFCVARVCGSLDELYHQTQAHLVVITVSIPSMAEVVKACLAHPWAVLLEKPPGCDLAEAEELEQAAAAAGNLVLVALNRRFYSSTRSVLADVALNDEPRFIHVQDQEDLRAAKAEGQPRLVLDNWMYANSIHLVDYFRIFGRGEILSVTPVFGPDMGFITSATITFESGDIGLYQCLWNRPGPWAVSVSLPHKRWELRPLEFASFQTTAQRQLQRVENSECDSAFKPGFLLQAEHAVAAVRGEPHESTTLAEAVNTMRLIHSIYACEAKV